MSNLYNLEPQPTAKVILHTTAGDLSLELFAKQTPLASRNFLQHCLDGYYTNTIFHRLVPGFIIQGGDPTGTGSGGESALDNGTPFEDEFHSRLKFNRRGLLGMANEGRDSNGSQFFLTLGVTAELQGRHTLFGRIEGETIYNLMNMGDAEMSEGEGSERPLYPTKITGAEVIVNPFEDMVARVKEAPRVLEEAGRKDKKRKKPAGKNVLSFGGEEGEEDAAPVLKKTRANPKLFGPQETTNEKEVAAPKQKKKAPVPVSVPEEDEHEVEVVPDSKAEKPQTVPEEESEEDEPVPDTSKSKLDETNAEIAALKASMKRRVDTESKEQEKPKSLLQSMIPSNSTRGRKRGKAADERGAFDLFKAFKSRLDGIPAEQTPENEPETTTTNGQTLEPTTSGDAVDEEAELCDLHFIANCQSCKSWDKAKPDGEAEADGDDDTGTWMAHRLTFAKDTLGKDLEWKRKMEEIEVIDPREKARAIKEEQKKSKERKKR